MRVKENVVLHGLAWPMRAVLIAAENIWIDLGRNEGVTVTCGLDGVHSAGSLHYFGYALDFRSRYFEPEEIAIAIALLRDALGSSYDVVEHETHIHVEYDMRGR